MKQANFKNVRVGERFRTDRGMWAKIRPCIIDGQMRNAVLFSLSAVEQKLHPETKIGLWTIGNVAVSILEDDES